MSEIMKTKQMTVTSEHSRGTWAGREVQTDEFPVCGVPNSIKKGDKIEAEYRSTPSYGLWFFKRKVKEVK